VLLLQGRGKVGVEKDHPFVSMLLEEEEEKKDGQCKGMTSFYV
jgi:hypothetical protein